MVKRRGKHTSHSRTGFKPGLRKLKLVGVFTIGGGSLARHLEVRNDKAICNQRLVGLILSRGQVGAIPLFILPARNLLLVVNYRHGDDISRTGAADGVERCLASSRCDGGVTMVLNGCRRESFVW